MHRFLIRRADTIFRVFGYEFRDHADGSFYVHFKTTDREGKPGKSEKISYHTTGRIKFDGPVQHVNYGEPIFAITEIYNIACLSLADLNVLPIVADIRSAAGAGP